MKINMWLLKTLEKIAQTQAVHENEIRNFYEVQFSILGVL